MELGRVFVCQPAFSGNVPASHRQFWVGGARPGDACWNRLDLCQEGGSLLADCFNKFWNEALNRQLAGEDITHFVMLHDDVVPEDGWVQKLLNDLAEYDADLCAAVVPIKNPTGLTSTAIADPNDDYFVERRITMSELDSLPEVFTAEDCGYPGRALLCNTGCWIARMDKPWRYHVKFEIRNRRSWCCRDGRVLETTEVIGEDGNIKQEYLPGMWGSAVDPEDWNFSRQLFRLGGKAVATKRVRLYHQGAIPYANYPGKDGQWGEWFFDQVFAKKFGGTPIIAPDRGVTPDLREVKGWLTPMEGMGLATLAADKDVVEIGSYCGKSTIWMARTAKRVTAVDTFKADGTFLRGRDTLEEFRNNLTKYGVADKVEIRVQDSHKGLGDGEFFDLAFIDGAHDYESVKRDFAVAVRVLKPGGIIAFHDYGNGLDAGVDMLVNQVLGNPVWSVYRRVNSMIALQHDPNIKLSQINLVREHINGKSREPQTTDNAGPCVAERSAEAAVV